MKCDVIYEIPCKSCNKSYIRETGQAFFIRKKEHQRECERENTRKFTRTQKQTADQENFKSVFTDHYRRNNHIVDWDRGRVNASVTNKLKRWIKESIETRKRASSATNWDEGACERVYALLQRPGGGVADLTGFDRSI